MQEKIKIYTDGSCNNKNGLFGGCGIVLIFQGHTKEISVGQYINTTSARMEIRAIIHGLRAIKNKNIPVDLYTDNQYCCNSISKGWAFKWEKEGWYNRLNSDLWREVLYEYRQFPDGYVKFNWLKGHAGQEQNERADHLAGIAAKTEKRMDCRAFQFK